MHLNVFLFSLSLALLFSCSQSPQKAVQKDFQEEKSNSKFELSYSFLDLEKSPNGVAPIRSKKDISLILASYFDIKLGSEAGSSIMGRINYRNNFKKEIDKDLYFKLDEGSEILELKNERDSYGRLFATLHTKKALNSEANIAFKVKLYKGETLLEEKQATVHVLDETTWESYFKKTQELVNKNTRLAGRYKLPKDECNKLLADLAKNKGRFSDLKFYEVELPKKKDKSFDRRAYSNLLIEGAERLAGLALFNSKIENIEKRKATSRLIAKAIAEYSRAFPIENFYTTYSIPHNDVTHQWRYGDPLIGASILILADLVPELELNAGLKKDFDAMNNFHLMTSMSLTEGYRDSKNLRYYLKQDNSLRFATGIWADANRHHRMRTWICQVALQMDYNQPLTYLPYWYFPYKEWGQQNTNILPEWEPVGSLVDLKIWTDTNGRLTSLFKHSGLKPDGSISHHTGVRQDMAHYAYGFEWMSEGLSMPANMLLGTSFEAAYPAFQSSVDFFLYSYPKMIYKGSMDYQTTGRSHYSDKMGDFAREVFIPGVEHVLDTEGKNKSPNSQKLQNYLDQLKDDMETDSGNTAFWVNDYMVHRQAGEKPYFMSVKLQSARSCGAEGFKGSGDYGFHNGSGIFQLKIDGREYDKGRYAMDWHAMPGLTEELRDDRIPLSSERKAYSTENFCNTLSDGKDGIASFQYSRTDPYSTAKAFKSYFLQTDKAIMMGNSIERSKEGPNKSICTTIDQVEWDKDLIHNLAGSVETVAKGHSLNKTFAISQASWLYHDQVAYFIIPNGEQKILLRSGSAINRSDKKSKIKQELFQLSIDHGANPQQESYHYVVVPHINFEDINATLESLMKLKFINMADHQLIWDKQNNHIQAVFKKAGSLKIDDLEITSDQAALVQFRKVGNQWQITAADPLHDYKLKEINVSINRPFKDGKYSYRTQGPEQKVLDCQMVKVTSKDGISHFNFQLPDESDAQAYALRHELYAGMSAVIILEAK